MKTLALAGDNVNPAIYWAERYHETQPIERLAPLAAHVIFAAHKLNNGGKSSHVSAVSSIGGERKWTHGAASHL
ncbi:MAG TPA: hypothetical protein VNO32_50680 [Candidatus Acidoferrum sp.]|nr:hypothetical protein [Candidatus Acidoferrum sp.]